MSKNLYKVINNRGEHRNVQADYITTNKGIVTFISINESMGLHELVALVCNPVSVYLASSKNVNKKEAAKASTTAPSQECLDSMKSPKGVAQCQY